MNPAYPFEQTGSDGKLQSVVGTLSFRSLIQSEFPGDLGHRPVHTPDEEMSSSADRGVWPFPKPAEESPMKLYRNSFPRKQDDRIREDIRRQLVWQTDIQSEEIEINVQESTVTLSGRVETRLERMEAENAAKAVFGVTKVRNNVLVEPKIPRTDDEIGREIAAGLRMMTSVLEEVPSVSVSDGVVTLRGALRWHFQRASAEKVADAVVGTRQVQNLIEVIPRLESRVEPAMERQPQAFRIQPQRVPMPGELLLLNGNHRQSRAM
ncbi:MAG TPA: BON domain-containing protein [Edaphobacter sp.]|nr:BON domain-containing protein [Edaphobacter sp.]